MLKKMSYIWLLLALFITLKGPMFLLASSFGLFSMIFVKEQHLSLALLKIEALTLILIVGSVSFMFLKASSFSFLLSLFVITVVEAALGLSLLVWVTRVKSSEYIIFH